KRLEDVLKNGPWMIHNSLIILKKWTMNTSLFKEELTRILVWGRSKFTGCLIEVRADVALKGSVTMGIPLPDDEECSSFPTIDKINNDGFQTVVNKRKSGKTSYTINNHSGVAADDPSKKLPAKKRRPHAPTCKPSVSTSNPYDVLDDMKSKEEAEVVYDETINL
nr:hypothetical protein [Tanacetum cinerariifolium]